MSATSIIYQKLIAMGSNPADAAAQAESFVIGAMTGTGLSYDILSNLYGPIPLADRVTKSFDQLEAAAEKVAQAAGIDTSTNAGQIAVQNIIPDIAIEASKGVNTSAPIFATAYATTERVAFDEVEIAAKAQSQAAVEFTKIIQGIANTTNTTVDNVLIANTASAVELQTALIDRAIDQQSNVIVGAVPSNQSTPAITESAINIAEIVGSAVDAALAAVDRNLTSPVQPLTPVTSSPVYLGGSRPAAPSNLALYGFGALALLLLLRR